MPVNGNGPESEKRLSLPIHDVRRQIIRQFSDPNKSSWIVLSETASGKSTQIPQMVYDSRLNNGKLIGCTQPRRVAAVSIASFVAQEQNCRVGELVGYNVRFENVTSPFTKIKYLTDGMLLREALLDPLLNDYSWIILDEVHERTIHTDVLLGIVKKAQMSRSSTSFPLKIVLMSATMDVDKFSDYFHKAPVLYVEGRLFPVEILYAPETFEDYSFNAMVTVCQLNKERPVTDSFLVFLTGQEEIDSFCSNLRTISKTSSEDDLPHKLHVVPLYAHLPMDQQLSAIKEPPVGQRKVVIATNIAETSITIPGVNVVIDSGRIKVKQYLPSSQLDVLKVSFVSQAQAVQRSGRAGRLQAGLCFRLYTESKFVNLPPMHKPEILRCNLAAVCLELLAMGVKDIEDFDFIDKPDDASVKAAIDQLCWLGALAENDRNDLTDDGKIMARFPLDPTLSKALLMARAMGCLKETLIVVSLLSVESIFHQALTPEHESRQAIFRSDDGDHVTLLNVYNAFIKNGGKEKARPWCCDNRVDFKNLCQAEKIVDQLSAIAASLDWNVDETYGEDTEPLRSSLAAGLFFKAALLQPDQSYKAVFSSRSVYLHPSSTLFAHKHVGKQLPQCVVYSDLVMTTKSYMRLVSVVNYNDLYQLVPTELRWRFTDSPTLGNTAAANGNGYHLQK